MQSLPNVLIAMQSIQRGIEEAQAKLDVIKGFGIASGGEELEQCIGILQNTWEVANDYEAALPTRARQINQA